MIRDGWNDENFLGGRHSRADRCSVGRLLECGSITEWFLGLTFYANQHFK
ncbi:MAG: hypothetical protein OJF50_002023 [Nitrospira sp.]|nr:hypothetical protein [Nitrospira sp.]